MSDSRTSKPQGDVLDDVLEHKILEELKRNSRINQKELAKILGTSVPSVQRAMGRLKDSKRIVRCGGKRFGYGRYNTDL